MNSQTRPTKKQRELLSFIEGFIATHGYGPSYREVMRSLDYRSVSTVANHIDNLITRGHLKKRDHSARSLEVCSVAEKAFAAAKPATEAEEKWLVRAINTKFGDVEASATNKSELDQLYVLVGALRILGLNGAAEACMGRLSVLERKLDA